MINVTKSYLPDKEKYQGYVDKIYDNCWLTNNGPIAQELEKRLREYLGVKHILLVSNGTLALQIAYRVLGLTGEVITTPFSFVATTSTLVWEGLKPRFADINKETLCLDPNNITEKINPNTSAILPVHVFGNACDIDKIQAIAKENNLKVVYDAAHTFDVSYKGKSILNYGDASTLSFHSTKLFHTIEGGAIIFNSEEHYNKAKKIINFGLSGPEDIEFLGINCKMNEFQAAMGLCVLDDLQKIKNGRKRAYDWYIENLQHMKTLEFQKGNEESTQNYAYFPVIFQSEEVLLKVKSELNNNGINPRRYFYPSLDTLNYLKHREYMPVSNDISKRILCLPMYDSLREEDITRICNIIKGVISHNSI